MHWLFVTGGLHGKVQVAGRNGQKKETAKKLNNQLKVYPGFRYLI